MGWDGSTKDSAIKNSLLLSTMKSTGFRRRLLLYKCTASTTLAALSVTFWNHSAQQVCLECSSGHAFTSKTALSRSVTLLFHIVVSQQQLFWPEIFRSVRALGSTNGTEQQLSCGLFCAKLRPNLGSFQKALAHWMDLNCNVFLWAIYSQFLFYLHYF